MTGWGGHLGGTRLSERAKRLVGVYYNEFEPQAAATLRELIRVGVIAEGDVDDRSIVDVSADDLKGYTQHHFFAGCGVWSYALRLAGWPDDLPVWTGSCPCQPFSVAGTRKGSDDERHLWPTWFKLIQQYKPEVVLGEQVASADVIGKVRHEYAGEDSTAWLDLVQTDVENAHYTSGRRCAARQTQSLVHGLRRVPEITREAMWVVGRETGNYLPTPWTWQRSWRVGRHLEPRTANHAGAIAANQTA